MDGWIDDTSLSPEPSWWDWHVPSDVCMRNTMGQPQAVKAIHVGQMRTGERLWTRTWSVRKGGMV